MNDKIISAGEGSEINIDEIKAINSYAGIISKDGSKFFQKHQLWWCEDSFRRLSEEKEYNYPFLETKNYKLKTLAKSIKDTTANLKSDDEVLVMKTKKIMSLIYERNLSLIN